MSQTPQVNLTALWRYVIDQVKTQTSTPGLWRSMEAATPIALENEELVIGYSGENAHQKSLLVQGQNRNMVDQILHAAARRPIRLRIIEGDSLQDWEAAKLSEQEGARLQQESRQQYRAEIEAGATWDAVGENIVRKIGLQPNRSLASVQGRMLTEAVTELAEAYGRLTSDPPSELEERNFSRALERISERVGVSSSMIAYLVHQRRLPSG